MIKILQKNLTVILTDKTQKIFLLLFIPFLIIIVDSYEPKWMYLSILFSFTYFLSITPFSYDVNFKTVNMINSLPITRKETVVYTYLSVFIYFIFSIAYTGVYLWVFKALGIVNISFFDIKMIVKVLPIIVISLAIVFPAYFKFTPFIARVVHVIIYVMFFTVIINKISIQELSSVNYSSFFGEGTEIYVVAVVLYLLSLVLSIKFYENREY